VIVTARDQVSCRAKFSGRRLIEFDPGATSATRKLTACNQNGPIGETCRRGEFVDVLCESDITECPGAGSVYFHIVWQATVIPLYE